MDLMINRSVKDFLHKKLHVWCYKQIEKKLVDNDTHVILVSTTLCHYQQRYGQQHYVIINNVMANNIMSLSITLWPTTLCHYQYYVIILVSTTLCHPCHYPQVSFQLA